MKQKSPAGENGAGFLKSSGDDLGSSTKLAVSWQLASLPGPIRPLRWVVLADEGRRGIQFSERIASLVRQDRFR